MTNSATHESLAEIEKLPYAERRRMLVALGRRAKNEPEAAATIAALAAGKAAARQNGLAAAEDWPRSPGRSRRPRARLEPRALALLDHYRRDPAPGVAGPASFIFPPVGEGEAQNKALRGQG